MQYRELLRFHLTGDQPLEDGHVSEGTRPVLLAPFQRLADLRYDYPLVLLEGLEEPLTRTLSEVFNEVLAEIAPVGAAGARLRRHVLHLEGRIRKLVLAGTTASLDELWDKATIELSADSTDETLAGSLSKARGALDVEGMVVDCDERLASGFFRHVWRAVTLKQAMEVRQELDELILRLSDILKADLARSPSGLAPDKLAGSVGASHSREFDFEAWSRLVTGPSAGALPVGRRRRIENVLATLETQRFFPSDESTPHSFQFDSCTEAAATVRRRLPEMVELVKAMTIARLEIENRYREPEHDRFFETFDHTSPAPEDLAGFPTYLVCLRGDALAGDEKAELVDILSSSLPIKVLVETSDILGEATVGDIRWSPGVAGGRLGNLAMGLGEAFVLQSTSSNLPRMEQAVTTGLSFGGPALFSVFTGSSERITHLPRYLSAAAAMEARIFPAFTYDPSAGDDWAARFVVDGNPHVEDDWPVDEIRYEDDDLAAIAEQLGFTFVDFAACDARRVEHFVQVPRSSWCDEMEPAWRFLSDDESNGKLPYVLMTTQDNVLQRWVVDSELIEAARRCRRQWHSLQELGGIHNSHARNLLARERARWEETREQETLEMAASSVAVITEERPSEEPKAPPTTEKTTEETIKDESPEAIAEPPPSVEPYIETARCTTCDECTAINPRMFAYDENKQAFIADLTAGTYRQMVEAAEACQVAIIHPGKPWNLAEPDLAQTKQRAAAFT